MQKKFILYDLSGISSKNQTGKEPVNSDSFRLLTPLSRSLGTACKARWNSVERANVRTSP